MARPTKQQALEMQEAVYNEWVKGCSHVEIAKRCNVHAGTVTRYVQKFLAAQPIAKLSKEEREAAVWQEWNEIREKMKEDIEEQRHRGRIKVTRTRHPDGSETVEQSMISGVDPQLYRAWGAHLDRKARQMLDQMPVAETTNISVGLVRDFLGQADAPAARLTPEQWNETIDVVPS